MLAGFSAATLQRFKLPPDSAHSASADEIRLIGALEHVLTVLDEVNLTRLAQNLIEEIKSTDDAAISANDFFREYPQFVSARTRLNFENVRSLFAEDLNDFERGLLAHLIPDTPRAKEIDLLNLTPDEKVKGFARRAEPILADPLYRTALAELVASAGADPEVLGHVELVLQSANLSSLASRITGAAAEETSEHVGNGRMSKRDLTVTSVLLGSLNTEIHRWADQQKMKDTPDRFIFKNGSKIIDIRRAESLDLAERYMARHMTLPSGLDRALIVLDSLLFLTPIPRPTRQLSAHLRTNAETLVSPVRLRLRAVGPKTVAPVPSIRAVAPLVLNLVDHTAPAPVKLRIRTRERTEIQSETVPPSWTPASVPSERSLLEYTSFVATPRSIDELRADFSYEFYFKRDAEPTPMRVRFAANVGAWMKENKDFSRRILNAMHLGLARGSLTGIKALPACASKRYDGLIYEVKINGKFRALMVYAHDEWQVLLISEKGHIERDCQWLAPLERAD